MTEQLPYLIDLQLAHVTQITDGGKKGPWMVRQNESSTDLHELSSGYSESQIFEIMDFAKKFELVAFNSGMFHMKDKQQSALAAENKLLKRRLRECAEQNEQLAATIQRRTFDGVTSNGNSGTN